MQELGIAKVASVPMYAQARYKYQLYVDGHCAAMRYASMMPLGSVILKESTLTLASHTFPFSFTSTQSMNRDACR